MWRIDKARILDASVDHPFVELGMRKTMFRFRYSSEFTSWCKRLLVRMIDKPPLPSAEVPRIAMRAEQKMFFDRIRIKERGLGVLAESDNMLCHTIKRTSSGSFARVPRPDAAAIASTRLHGILLQYLTEGMSMAKICFCDYCSVMSCCIV